MLSVKEFIAALQTVLPTAEKPYELHEPTFEGREGECVKEAIDTKWVSSAGPAIVRFEELLAKFTGVKRAVAVSNGTVALQMCLKLAGLEPGDEVLVPTLTFVATANAVVHAGGVPHFVDCERSTLGVDPDKLRQYLKTNTRLDQGRLISKNGGRRIRALVVMHTFGHPVRLKECARVAEDFGLVLIEDAAESLGSFCDGKHTGGMGLLSSLSFNGNKIVTTGGGGAILTNDDKLADLAKHLTTTAKLPHAFEFNHDQVGYNFRLPNINASLGVAQMEQIPKFIERKRKLAQKYKAALANIKGMHFFEEPVHARSNYWLNAILLDDAVLAVRNEVIRSLHGVGIKARPTWTLMHRLPMYLENPRMDLAVAERLELQIINLPSSVFLG